MLAECWRGGMPVLAAAEAMINDAFGLREGDLWADADKDAEAFAHSPSSPAPACWPHSATN